MCVCTYVLCMSCLIGQISLLLCNVKNLTIYLFIYLSAHIPSRQDVLISSLESSLERYKVLGNPAANEETKIQVLERSLGAHERALGLLRGEYQRECAEMREAEEEIEKLRAVIANKVCM